MTIKRITLVFCVLVFIQGLNPAPAFSAASSEDSRNKRLRDDEAAYSSDHDEEGLKHQRHLSGESSSSSLPVMEPSDDLVFCLNDILVNIIKDDKRLLADKLTLIRDVINFGANPNMPRHPKGSLCLKENLKQALFYSQEENNTSLSDWLIKRGVKPEDAERDPKKAKFFIERSGKVHEWQFVECKGGWEFLDDWCKFSNAFIVASQHCKDKDAAIIETLLELGADVNGRNANNTSALHYAAWRGETAIIQLLLQRGADIYCEDAGSATPLGDAICNQQLAAVDIMIRKGGSLTRDYLGKIRKSALDIELFSYVPKNDPSWLRLLIAHGATVNEVFSGEAKRQKCLQIKKSLTLEERCFIVLSAENIDLMRPRIEEIFRSREWLEPCVDDSLPQTSECASSSSSSSSSSSGLSSSSALVDDEWRRERDAQDRAYEELEQRERARIELERQQRDAEEARRQTARKEEERTSYYCSFEPVCQSDPACPRKIVFGDELYQCNKCGKLLCGRSYSLRKRVPSIETCRDGTCSFERKTVRRSE